MSKRIITKEQLDNIHKLPQKIELLKQLLEEITKKLISNG